MSLLGADIHFRIETATLVEHRFGERASLGKSVMIESCCFPFSIIPKETEGNDVIHLDKPS
jgi:hypothetical protein